MVAPPERYKDPSTSIIDLDVSEDNRETSGDEEDQLVCGEALNTNEKLSFTPELLTESGQTSYRFRCPGPGAFQCAFTDMVFVVRRKAELLYRSVQWDESLLQSAGKTAAGSLFDIKCPEDAAVSHLHLPHCEIMDALLSDGVLTVVHITDDGMSVLKPLKITDSHVVVEVRHLSLFGLVWDLVERLWTKPVNGRVQLFLGPQLQESKTLYVYLLPRNVDLKEVMNSQQLPYEYIETTPRCRLIKNQSYSLDCPEATEIQPEEEEFDMDFGPNYDPMFEIFLPTNTKTVTVTVQDQTQERVWSRKVNLPASRTGTQQSNIPAEDRVPAEVRVPEEDRVPAEVTVPADQRLFSVRTEFIDRVSGPVLNQLLDKLLARGIINDHETESVRGKVRADKARDLIDTVRNKGAEGSSVLIAALCEVDPCLSRELNLS
ncbi:caspase recruitment domain-containing protein 8 [Larimichthys crocea]|uniref:caspase recruitment domain-containing protein 8 n=1 Tax=Larimichthys crocea TaxID=215358 RepID=UPI000901F2E5|nr:caspase recruitment domain-containing protein 8 [Larimichthys crocea]